MGFSLHANTAVRGNDRQGLERLVRYGARGPVAESRLRRLDDGRYEYTPKKGVAFTPHGLEARRRPRPSMASIAKKATLAELDAQPQPEG